jgi:hypothetical protein
MGLMLLPEEEQGDGGENRQCMPESPGIVGCWGALRVMGHVGTLQKPRGAVRLRVLVAESGAIRYGDAVAYEWVRAGRGYAAWAT